MNPRRSSTSTNFSTIRTARLPGWTASYRSSSNGQSFHRWRATWRELSNLILDSEGQNKRLESSDEQTHRAYVHWMPILELALSVEFVYDKFTAAKANFLTDLFGVPDNLVTYSVPFGVRYFHPSGFFAGAGATYVNQEVNRSDSSGLPEGFDDFFLVDAALGYRLPRRFGIVSLSVSNLFDQRFYYQDDSFRTVPARETEPPQAAVGPYVPERTIMGQITINF